MPATVERPHKVGVVTHSTAYSPDRESAYKDRSNMHQQSDGEENAPHEAEDLSSPEEPAVVVVHPDESHLLDGVTSYRSLARKLSGEETEHLDKERMPVRARRIPTKTVCNAYADHKDDTKDYAINLET